MKVLEPIRFAGLPLRNRIAVAPMSRMQANADGTATAEMPEYYSRFAVNGVGLIFSEAIYVDAVSSRAYFNQPGLASEAQRDSWLLTPRAVHSAEGRIFAQLQHGGRLAEPGLNPLHLSASDGAAAGVTWQTGRPNALSRAATVAEIDDIIEAFGVAARHAIEAGFDGVEIHGARGYLIDDFMSATSNRREDGFGGSFKRRLEMPLAVIRRVRKAIGASPLSFNLSLYKMDDGHYQPPGGQAEVIAIVRALREGGVDIIHVSTRRALRPEMWDEPLSRTVRNASNSGYVIANGGLSTLEDCEAALDNNDAMLVSLARPFLANPDWLARVKLGQPLARYAPGQERLPPRIVMTGPCAA